VNVCFRRIALIPVHPGEGPLTEPTAAVHPRQVAGKRDVFEFADGREIQEGSAAALESGLWPSCDMLPVVELSARGRPIEPCKVLWKLRPRQIKGLLHADPRWHPLSAESVESRPEWL